MAARDTSDGWYMGPTGLTNSERKRRKRAKDARRRASLVNIGQSVSRWKTLCDRLQLSGEELATVLLDYYEDHRNCVKVGLSSTPREHRMKFRDDISLSGVSDSSDSERTVSIVSGVLPLDESGDNIDISGYAKESRLQDTQAHANAQLSENSSGQFDDATDAEGGYSTHGTDTDEDVYDPCDDPCDITWQPSMSNIHLDEDSFLEENQPEIFPEDIVLDADFDMPDGAESGDEEEDSNTTVKLDRSGFLRLVDSHEAATAEKSIAYTSCLLQLAELQLPTSCKVKTCQSPLTSTSEKKGTAVFLIWKCTEGHIAKIWCSQPKLPRGVLCGDFALAACILLSGNNYKKIALMLKFLELGCVNSSSFWRIQSLYCCPAINTFWEKELNKTLEPLNGRNVIVAGDGCMDSPGFSAKYCTYTVINIETQDILDMQIVDKRHTDLKSTNVETKGFKDALKTLGEKGLNVKEVVTDAHPSISAHMRKDHSNIKHSYDVWHGAKNLSKKITAIAYYKATRDLLPWRGDTIGHFWHSCQSACGDETVLREKWTGVVHHTVDEHKWALGSCDHEEIEEQSKDYLTPGSTAHKALTDFVFDDRLLRNLKYYVNYRSTAELEGFQNHILMYAGKRFAYTYPVYKARCQLAGLDYQLHKDRPLLMSKDGSQRWHRSFNKNSVRWRAYAMREQKPYSYVTHLLANIFQRRIDDNGSIARRVELLESDPRRLVSTIAPVPPPPTEQLVAEHKSRFSSV